MTNSSLMYLYQSKHYEDTATNIRNDSVKGSPMNAKIHWVKREKNIFRESENMTPQITYQLQRAKAPV